MATRTTGAVALRPTGNKQGGYHFLSLTTGRKLNRKKWTELPVPQEAIARVHTLARCSKADRCLRFAWKVGTLIKDDDPNGEDYSPVNNDESDDDNDNLLDDADSANVNPDPLDVLIAGVMAKNTNEGDNDDTEENNDNDETPHRRQ